MRFVTTIGNKELETLAWLLETRTKVHNVEFYKGLVLSIAILVATYYNFFCFEESTTAQKCILLILLIACIARTVFCKIGKVNYFAIAKQKNKKMQKKPIICDFNEEEVSIDNGKQTEELKYAELKEWGEHKNCIYILFQSGAAIVLDEAKYESQDIDELKKLLKDSTSCE